MLSLDSALSNATQATSAASNTIPAGSAASNATPAMSTVNTATPAALGVMPPSSAFANFVTEISLTVATAASVVPSNSSFSNASRGAHSLATNVAQYASVSMPQVAPALPPVAATPCFQQATPCVSAQHTFSTQPPGGDMGVESLGLFLGDRIMPIPQKIIRKILALEFVEMRMLLSESWLSDLDSSTHCCNSRPENKKQTQVNNIFIWLRCYGALVGVLASRYPHKVAELIAYQSTIITCYTDFEGNAWVTYDRAYRRQAAVRKSLDWSRLNPTLYSLVLPGELNEI